ncbi:mechanosensitive ion channel domain-containing protein [Citreimonas salinaria]|uniref:Small-conductance mechanosensitive channel n=1 Tax=Citreimonas salinaria TaxID=321339 RepID=A0A1H3ILV8_9RHOB|nr:mechanosensitive ion channel domain-containing protein [Citreimonas salinaria]SDY28766.1 Small-conductance mechanosensitive channel [Citreimonas salinaria]
MRNARRRVGGLTQTLLAAVFTVCALGAAIPALAQETAPETPAAPAEAAPPEAALPAEAIDALVGVLQDDEARARLLEALQAAQQGAAGEIAEMLDEGAPALAVERGPSLGTQIAEFTQGLAQATVAQVSRIAESVRGGNGTVLGGFSGDELSVLLQSLQSLFLIILITVAVFATLRALLRRPFQRLGARAAQANMVNTALIFIGSVAIDAAIVLAAWALGYAITLLLLGDYARIDFRQALYLNAFLLVEMVKVAVRAVVSPTTAGLRMIRLSDRAAILLNRYANVVISVLGYGQLLVVPIMNRNLSYAAGIAVSAVLSLVALLFVVWIVLRHREPVAGWLLRRIAPERDAAAPSRVEAEDGTVTTMVGAEAQEAPVDEAHRPATTFEAAPAPEGDGELVETGPLPEREPPEKQNGALATLMRNWHWFALAYLAFMFVAVVTQPTWRVIDYLFTSLQVLAAVLVGSVIQGALGRWLRSGIRIPEELRLRLPLLEPRLNAIVPKIINVLRIIVAVLVLAYTLDAIGLFDTSRWIGTEFGLNLSGRLVTVLLILLAAALIWLAINSWVDYRLNPDYGSIPTARETTLLALARNAAIIALIILTLMFTLSELGLNIGPLIASAGVLGLAIGFGAQKLVQDIITGVFIQFDNAMNVGDVVSVGGTSGVVEKLTVRSVSLRDLNGTYHIIPFSSVDMVSNFMRDFAYHLADMGIAYREDTDEARKAMFDAFDELMKDPEHSPTIIGELEWFGLQSLGDSAVVLRARIKTLPGKQWGVGRAYNGLIKRIFDERGIEIPFPHRTIYLGESKSGRTQTLRLHDADREAEGGSEGAEDRGS